MKTRLSIVLALGGCLTHGALGTPFHVFYHSGTDANEVWLVHVPSRTTNLITTDLTSWQPSHAGLAYDKHLELDIQPRHDPCGPPDPDTNYYRFEYRQEQFEVDGQPHYWLLPFRSKDFAPAINRLGAGYKLIREALVIEDFDASSQPVNHIEQLYRDTTNQIWRVLLGEPDGAGHSNTVEKLDLSTLDPVLDPLWAYDLAELLATPEIVYECAPCTACSPCGGIPCPGSMSIGMSAWATIDWADAYYMAHRATQRLSGSNLVLYASVTNDVLPGGSEFSKASALQAAGGLSALSCWTASDSNGLGGEAQAVATYSVTVTNPAPVGLPMSLAFTISPGRVALIDGSTNGMGTNAQQALMYFNITSDRVFSGGHTNETWRWTRTVAGGLRQLLVSDTAYDPQGIGIPNLHTNMTPDGLEIAWDSMTGVLNFDVVEAYQTFTMTYTIIVDTKSRSVDRSRPNGVLAEAGDPFELSTGSMSAPGASFSFTVGDVVVGQSKPPALAVRGAGPGQLELSFNKPANRAYALEYSEVLPASAWIVLTNLAAEPNGSVQRVTDGVGASQRFYRLRMSGAAN